MKNEKMIMLIHVLERGNDYTVFTVKGSELQETTVCHAEENANINEITKEIFENNRKCAPNYAFALSPIKQLSFSVYEDVKFKLTGVIDSPEFARLVKGYFMRVLAYKLRELKQ